MKCTNCEKRVCENAKNPQSFGVAALNLISTAVKTAGVVYVAGVAIVVGAVIYLEKS